MTSCLDWKTALSSKQIDPESLQRMRACGITAIEYGIAAKDVIVDWKIAVPIPWEMLRNNTDAAGIERWSCHLPFSADIDISLADEAARRATVDLHKEIMTGAAAVGIRRFVLHPSSEPISDEERPLRMALAKGSLKELADLAERLGAVICVEDLPRTCLGHTVAEMLELLSADERLRVCFDVNHLLTAYGSTHEEFVEKLGSKIITTHMSDYDFADEKHFFPGMGMLNWKMVVEALEKADYTGPFLYEGGFAPSLRAPEVPFGTWEDARERHLRIKELTGKNYLGK